MNEGKEIPDLKTACTHFIERILPKPKEWGGSETLKAVTLMKAVNILIINEKGTCYFTNNFNSQLKKTVILAFGTTGACRLNEIENENQMNSGGISNAERNHYNSVARMDQNDIFKISQMLASQIRTRNITAQIDSENSTVAVDD